MKYAFLLPVYNHGKSAYQEVGTLLEYGYDIILVDDGSDDETRQWLEKARGLSGLVTVLTLSRNSGKGAAVVRGIEAASAMGLTHVFQIDADGQHDLEAVPRFLEASRKCPDCAVIGHPVFDGSVPQERLNGRKVANTFAHIVTMDRTSIVDCMCGFRIYPVATLAPLVARGHWDYRMGFDIEVLVRMYWKGIGITSLPVKVTYPQDALSHFHPVKDNVRISIVFTRLCFALPLHIPAMLRRRRRGR